MPLAPLPRWLQITLLTALAYAAAGQLALWLAAPPAFAAPLYPAAGIALAAVLIAGRRALPGVVLGALFVNGFLGSPRELSLGAAWATALAIALGAGLQAAAGAWLVQRNSRPPLALDEPREAIALGLLGGLLACLTSASVATAALWLAGSLPGDAVFPTWATWWAGDALGVLIAAPITLTVIGKPRALWTGRRWTVGLPLLLVGAVLTFSTMLAGRSMQQRQRDAFEREAGQAADALQTGLREHLHALEAMHGLFMASDLVKAAEMEAATASWLQPGNGLLAIGFSQHVGRPEVPSFEAVARRDGPASFRVFDRAGADPALTASDASVVAIRHIQPLGPNIAALGVNALSIPAARAAIEASVRTDQPVATAGFHLTQATDQDDATGVVVYRAVYRGPTPQALADRQSDFSGVVFATLQMDRAVATMFKHIAPDLQWCLLDRTPAAPRLRLAGAVGCELAPPQALRLPRQVEYAGRKWELLMSAPPRSLPRSDQWSLWFFSFTGLLSVSMLSALLLTITGRARRVEVAVAERTAALRHEVAERQRTEQALRDSEQRLRNIMDHVPLGVLYADMAGDIREANPRMRELLGPHADGSQLSSIMGLTHPEDRGPLEALIDKLRRDPGRSAHLQMRLLRGDGQTLWMRAGLSALRDATGKAQRLVGVFEDITENLKLVEAERARERAEAASRAKSDFLSRMSHELRTPLNAILGFTQLLSLDRKPPLSTRQAERAAQVQQAGWHLLHMIDDMLDLSRIEAGQVNLNMEPVALAPLLSESLALVEQAAAARRIRIRNDVAGSNLTVSGDRTRIKQVLTNLLSNAVKYNHDGGTLHCEAVRAAGGQVAVRVRDSGIGMTPEQLRGLFHPFNRLGREHSDVEGTGLGLVISRRLTELMGGSLVADSVVGEGTLFVLALNEAHTATQAPHDEPLTLTRFNYRHRRVVYIEDNETNAEVMRGVLARRPQIALSVHGTAASGLAAIHAELPSLVLLDMQLPDMDGLSVLRRLREDPRTEHLAVMVVSADATTTSIERAFEEGANDYVTKPVDVTAFLSQLDLLLDRQESRFGV